MKNIERTQDTCSFCKKTFPANTLQFSYGGKMHTSFKFSDEESFIALDTFTCPDCNKKIEKIVEGDDLNALIEVYSKHKLQSTTQ